MAPRAAATAATILVVAGCAPSTLQECMEAATTKPTSAGVQLAARECRERFPKQPWEEFDPSTAVPAPGETSATAATAPAAPAPQEAASWWSTVEAWFAGLTKMEKALFAAIGAAIFVAAVRR